MSVATVYQNAWPAMMSCIDASSSAPRFLSALAPSARATMRRLFILVRPNDLRDQYAKLHKEQQTCDLLTTSRCGVTIIR